MNYIFKKKMSLLLVILLCGAIHNSFAMNESIVLPDGSYQAIFNRFEINNSKIEKITRTYLGYQICSFGIQNNDDAEKRSGGPKDKGEILCKIEKQLLVENDKGYLDLFKDYHVCGNYGALNDDNRRASVKYDNAAENAFFRLTLLVFPVWLYFCKGFIFDDNNNLFTYCSIGSGLIFLYMFNCSFKLYLQARSEYAQSIERLKSYDKGFQSKRDYVDRVYEEKKRNQ